MRHLKYQPGSLVLLRQIDSDGNVVTIWGGQVLASIPKELTVLAIEMVYQQEEWHCVGEFRKVMTPPHRLPYKWDFPRLLVKYEANDIDLRARPVIETALKRYRLQQANS
ncbi:MAG: hypothetical protein A2W37_16715 [Chloroflexi bacterium RBG_16_63_12]|jgi:hypothetical protein|nr:hypothetical protein [Anaerolineales bacterium]OGO50415.1 MAG: hypothetical protein A2W37_16715 [Chloroflexi bacterium RBG_16_63_12]